MKMKTSVALIFALAICCQCFSQNKRIESLNVRLKSANEHSKIEIFNKLASEYSSLDTHKAILNAEKAIELAKKYNDINAESEALYNIGVSYGKANSLGRALEYLSKSLELAQKSDNKERIATDYNAIGTVYRLKSNSHLALDYFNKSLVIRKALGDKKMISYSLNNIGLVYYHWGHLDSALYYYEQSLEALGNQETIDFDPTYTNIGNIYLEFNKPEKALEMYLKALAIKQSIEDKSGVARLQINIGNAYMAINKNDTAIYYFEKAKKLAEEVNNNEILCNALNNTAEIYMIEKRYEKALSLYLSALKYGESTQNNLLIVSILTNIGESYMVLNNLPKALEYTLKSCAKSEILSYRLILKENYSTLAEIYQKMGDFRKAFDYQKRLTSIKDTLYNDQLLTKTAELNSSLDKEKREKENIILRKEKERQNSQIISLIISVILLIIIVLTVLSRFVLKKRINKILALKNEELVEANSWKDNYMNVLNKELVNASEYITSLIPKEFTSDKISTKWMFIPSAKLGGDSFGYHWLDEEHFAIYLLDVSGHGVGSALHSVSILNALKFETLPNTDFKKPQQVLKALNRAFQMKEHNYIFFTLWYGVYNVKTGRLKYASAGHPPALVISEDDETKKLHVKNVFIGGVKHYEFEADSIVLDKPSTLYVFSDGTYEIKNSEGKYGKLEDIYEFLTGYEGDRCDDIHAVYENAVSIRQTDQLEDDFSIMKIMLS